MSELIFLSLTHMAVRSSSMGPDSLFGALAEPSLPPSTNLDVPLLLLLLPPARHPRLEMQPFNLTLQQRFR